MCQAGVVYAALLDSVLGSGNSLSTAEDKVGSVVHAAAKLENGPSATVEGISLVWRQNLAEHPEHGVAGQGTGGQLDLTPRQRTTKLVDGGRIQYNVRLLAHVHDERLAVQADNRVEQRFQKSHVTIIFRVGEKPAVYAC